MKSSLPLLCAATLVLSPSPLIAGPLAPPDKTPVPSSSTGGWRVSGGLMHRSIGGFDWLTGTRSRSSMLTLGPGSYSDGLEALGPTNAFADRTYFDGFVFQDAGTANGGDTWYWGYDSGSQVFGDSIYFRGGNGTTAFFQDFPELLEPGGWSSDPDGTAPYVQLEWIQPCTDSLNIGFQSSISFMNTGASRSFSTFAASRSRADYGIVWTDTYYLSGSQAPQAPYAGTLGGPGILLSNIPADRAPGLVTAGGEAVNAFNSIRTDIDLSLSTITLGPVLEYQSGKFALQASAGLTINIADWDAEQNETLHITNDVFIGRLYGPDFARAETTREFRERDDGTSVLPGFFLQAAVSRQLNERWSLTAFGRYDWVGEVDVHAGPSTGSADLSGWSLGGGVGFNF